jgi:queuine/archaeosine tRNA-ribosyltransferase
MPDLHDIESIVTKTPLLFKSPGFSAIQFCQGDIELPGAWPASVLTSDGGYAIAEGGSVRETARKEVGFHSQPADNRPGSLAVSN